MKGKDRCKILKEIRRKIAEQNDIEFIVSECKHKGDCKGTCPKCEAELRYLERELARRQRLGKTIAVSSIALTLAVTAPSCAYPGDEIIPPAVDRIPAASKTESIDVEFDGEMGDIITTEPLFGETEPVMGEEVPPDTTEVVSEELTSNWTEIMGDMVMKLPPIEDFVRMSHEELDEAGVHFVLRDDYKLNWADSFVGYSPDRLRAVFRNDTIGDVYLVVDFEVEGKYMGHTVINGDDYRKEPIVVPDDTTPAF